MRIALLLAAASFLNGADPIEAEFYENAADPILHAKNDVVLRLYVHKADEKRLWLVAENRRGRAAQVDFDVDGLGLPTLRLSVRVEAGRPDYTHPTSIAVPKGYHHVMITRVHD